MITELTVPWEEGTKEAYERKRPKYADLVAECQGKGWRATTYPLEVGCCSFMSLSTKRFLRDIGFISSKAKRVIQDLAEEAERERFWLWLRRRDKNWGNKEAM